MGFLSKLVHLGQKPFKATGMTGLDPLGTATGAYKTPQAITNMVNGTAAPGTDVATGGEASYYGDPNDSGYGSLTQPFDVEQFYNYADPGYAFQLQQGTQALQNSAAAGSGALSGAALKDLLKYNQDYAGTAYNDAFSRYQTQQGNIFSRLSSLATLGQDAAAGVGAQGTQLAGNAGQAISNAGSAAGAGIVGAGNSLNQGLTNYWLMRQLSQPSTSSGGAGSYAWSNGMPYAGANA
jgi:hypothetical protein